MCEFMILSYFRLLEARKGQQTKIFWYRFKTSSCWYGLPH